MRRNVAILALLVICTACPRAGYTDESTPTPFDPYHVPGVYWPEWAPYLKTGSGTIEGRFVAKTKFFGETTFPKTLVDLLPATMLSWWIIKSSGYNLEHDDYSKHDPLPHFPSQLVPYERRTFTDDNGYFEFTNLPDGKYYVFGTARQVEFRHPTRYTTQGQIADNGDTVTTLEKTEGLKELSDLVTIAASATVNTASNPGREVIDSFDIFGESTCCKAEI